MKQIAAALLVVLFLFPVLTMAADFDGDSRNDIAIFRPASGLWAVRGVTRAYFGQNGDEPRPGDYDGDGIADIAVFRENSGLWAVRGVTRAYFGSSGDTALQGGGGQRIYDYVVKAGDGTDLVQALESSSDWSVFVPAGSYTVSQVINVAHIRQITGEKNLTTIQFIGDAYLSITSAYCTVEKIKTRWGGDTSVSRGNIYVSANYVTLRDCRSSESHYTGITVNSSYGWDSVINCVASGASDAGFYGGDGTSRYIGCSAIGCKRGFSFCRNISGCSVYGNNDNDLGYYQSQNITASTVQDCSDYGFHICSRLSACQVVGDNHTNIGYYNCYYLSSCYAQDCATQFSACFYVDSDSCNN